MKKIYLFSGLGADERAFGQLQFPEHQPIFIKWIAPLHREKLPEYAVRISSQIDEPDATLAGISFGGIVAVEVAKHISTRLVILISSAKSSAEIPWYFKLAGKLYLHRLLPTAILKSSGAFTNWLFGVRLPEQKILLSQILADTNPVFLKWAINQIVLWKSSALPKNFRQVHGSADRILPVRFIKESYIIKGGGHLMTITHPTEINFLLAQVFLIFT